MSLTAPTQAAAIAAPRRKGSGRLDLLDGVRGWSALSVILFHVFWEIFGALVPAFRNPVTGFLFDGQLAVCVFFVLSGEALSAAFFAGKGDAATFRLAIKRYPRLAIPILASCLIVFALDRGGLVYSSQAAAIVDRGDWMGGWLRAPLTLGGTLRYSLFDVFVSADIEHAVNPTLWTMKVELMGSFLVFAVLLAWKRLSRPRLLVLALFVAARVRPDRNGELPVVFLRRRGLRRRRARLLQRAPPASRLGAAGDGRGRRRGGRPPPLRRL